MIFNDHAAGVGVADIEDKIDRNGGRTQGVSNKFHFRNGDLLAQHSHQVEPVGLIFKAAHRLVQVALGAVFDAGGVAAECLPQPAVNPGLIEKTQHLVVAPGQRKTGAVQNIVFDR
ncbi:hypothetical protein D3C72_774440 [compost metagenome]